MRPRKPKDIPQRLERYSHAIENAPFDCRGRWLSAHGSNCSKLHVDLGCGKGAYSIACAQSNPQDLYVGIDCEDICIALAAQRSLEAGLSNAVFVLGNADDIAKMFGADEIDVLHLNFSTPFPKRRHSSGRLCHMDRLLGYRELLGESGELWMKTDSQPLFDFGLTQFEIAGYQIDWLSRDMHAEEVEDIRTEYELRLTAEGAKIHGLVAHVGPLKGEPVQTAPLSLQHYLPEDLESLDYIPYGMGPYVENVLSQRRNERERALRHAKAKERLKD